ncbi:TadE/TadG family type IV pilus assembly protein [Sphingomonas xanthus]|uniref:Pilus assembly protein n=1 Tax=Sphingomonas xanthus TaxID=2594473 RepID=A0A516IPN5_9SPHN|nr:TadE family protein [Sphingomonas xanthus]QDP18883.1 pilus assembly protein [Sphingomonas xanthus]
MTRPNLLQNDRGAAVIEMAFALPILILFIWMMVQLGLVFRASSGIQHALGEGARTATVWSPSGADPASIKTKVEESVYGIGPGTFTVPTPTRGTDCDNRCLDVTVQYSQATDLLFFPGPTINVSHSKRVWTAGN